MVRRLGFCAMSGPDTLYSPPTPASHCRLEGIALSEGPSLRLRGQGPSRPGHRPLSPCLLSALPGAGGGAPCLQSGHKDSPPRGVLGSPPVTSDPGRAWGSLSSCPRHGALVQLTRRWLLAVG